MLNQSSHLSPMAAPPWKSFQRPCAIMNDINALNMTFRNNSQHFNFGLYVSLSRSYIHGVLLGVSILLKCILKVNLAIIVITLVQLADFFSSSVCFCALHHQPHRQTTMFNIPQHFHLLWCYLMISLQELLHWGLQHQIQPHRWESITQSWKSFQINMFFL